MFTFSGRQSFINWKWKTHLVNAIYRDMYGGMEITTTSVFSDWKKAITFLNPRQQNQIF